ncbi:MAG: hypothetical protein JWN21_632 [Sphingomonas bacterium]|nr:hypothetical protein [Sphingomonas bacterium]
MLLALAAAILVVGCTAAPRAVAPPARVVALPPAPAPAPPAADWLEWAVTAGTWRYGRDERGTVAMFGAVGADAVAVLRCDRQGGRLFLSVAGDTPTPLTVRTSSIARTVQLGATGGTPSYLAATLAPADPLLDAMAFSRGRFALSRAGAAPLVLPAWAEVGRVIEDCRA